MTATRHAEVAGAGFAGLTVATALARRGWTVRVHEAASELRDIGAGIFLWENGLRVLQETGAYEDVIAHSHAATRWEERDADDRQIGSRPLPLPGGVRMITLTREDLHRAVADAAVAAGVEVQLGSAAVSADPDGALITSDGTSWPADVVVAADGIRSATRQSLPLETEHLVYPVGIARFLVPLDVEPTADSRWHCYVNHTHLPTGRRVLYVPCNPRQLYLLLGAPIDDEALRMPLSVDLWGSTFPALRDVLSNMPATPRLDRYELVRLSAWSSGVVAVLGDAAHAMPPTLGQGAGTAMVNALALAKAMDEHDLVPDALRAWERAERPITEAAQSTSLELLDHLTPEPGERRDSWSDDGLRIATHDPLAS